MNQASERDEVVGEATDLVRLDVTMAERVMEWKLDRTSRDVEGRIRWYVVDDCQYAVCDEQFSGMIERSRWSPSTDIAAAMEVVEKMRETHDVEIKGAKGGGWYVCFEPESFRHAAAGGPDLPDVICRAALAALAAVDAIQEGTLEK